MNLPVAPAPVRAIATSDKVPTLDAGSMATLVLHAPGLAVAAQRVVDLLADAGGFDRCTLAIASPAGLRLLAASGTDLAASPERTDSHDALRLGALEESLAQAVSLSWPPTVSESVVDRGLRQVTHEQRLLQAATGGAVASLPIGLDGVAVAAACFERADPGRPISAEEITRLQPAIYVAALALRSLARGERGLGSHARARLGEAWHTLRRPDRRLRRRVIIAAALATSGLVAIPVDQEVGGRARLEGRLQRIISAPADGFVKTPWVRPGDHVKAGQPLVDLVDGDLRLERERLASQLDQRENGYAEAMGRADRVGASSSLAQVGETQAQLGLVDAQLARGRIVAPFDALVVQGDLAQSSGAPLKQGDPLLTLAADGAGQRVVIEVDEIDIAAVRPGQMGRLAVSSLPWQSFGITVERVDPTARAVEGRNVFDVEARLDAASSALRPGLLGRAQVDVGRAPLAWTWGVRLVESARVAWWSWLA